MSYKYNVFTFNLANGLDETLEIQGGFAYVKDATDLNTTVSLRPDSKSNDAITLIKQYGFIGRFKRLYLSAAAQAGKTLELIVTNSYDEFRIFEQAQVQDIATISSVEKVTVASNGQVSVGAAATIIKAANTSRKSLAVINHAAVDIYIGTDNTVTTGNGFLLKAGGSIVFDKYTGDIYGITASGSHTVSYMEEG